MKQVQIMKKKTKFHRKLIFFRIKSIYRNHHQKIWIILNAIFLGICFAQICRPQPAYAAKEKIKNIENKSIVSQLSSPLIATYKILKNVLKGTENKLYLVTTTFLILISFCVGVCISMKFIKDGETLFTLKYKLKLLEAAVKHQKSLAYDKNRIIDMLQERVDQLTLLPDSKLIFSREALQQINKFIDRNCEKTSDIEKILINLEKISMGYLDLDY